MAASSFSDMKARWIDALATDETDAEFMARLPDLIGDAELMCLRDLDPVYARKNGIAVTMTPGDPLVAQPADCWVLRRLILVSGTTRTALLQRQLSFLDEYWTDPSATGTPRYWCMPAEGLMQLAPTPAAGFTLLADYTYRPDTLSEANPTTWLCTHYPDLLFCAGMIWLAGWTKNYGTSADDPGGFGHYQGRYQALLGAARLDEARKKGDSPMEVGPSAPVPVTGG